MLITFRWKNLEETHKWFAWYPYYLGKQRMGKGIWYNWVWLERVNVRYIPSPPDSGFKYGTWVVRRVK